MKVYSNSACIRFSGNILPGRHGIMVSLKDTVAHHFGFFRSSEAHCCFVYYILEFFCNILETTLKYIYISADVRTPKRVNLKVIAPRVN